MKGDAPPYPVKAVAIGLRSRLLVRQARLLAKPLARWLWSPAPGRLEDCQQQLRRLPRLKLRGIAQKKVMLGGVPAVRFGRPDDTNRPLILYLHGGGFCLPPVPHYHHGFVSRLCRDLAAGAALPDYRLSPQHRYPAALDDCEAAYRELLALGHDARSIVLMGESAGGTLVLALLQRILTRGLARPACGVVISAGSDLTHVDALASRRANALRDPVLPPSVLAHAIECYAGGLDRAHPEISPARADFRGFPPLHFLVGETEILLDDTLICAERARLAGVDTRLDVWPVLPHAFPLLGNLFPEARLARREIVSFVRDHL